MGSFNLVHSKQKLNSNRHSYLLIKSVYWALKCVNNLSLIRFNKSGRGAEGHVICRTKGSRHKFRIRVICKPRYFFASVPSILLRIEYAPNRSASLGVLHFMNDICYYSILTDGLVIGDKLYIYSYSINLLQSRISGLIIFKGDTCDLFCLALGSTLHSLELKPRSDKQYATAAGCFAVLLQKFQLIVIGLIRLPSGLLTNFSLLCYATKGIVSNSDHKHSIIGQAGRNIRMGKRPIVRGVARNPIDHPHGGGEGKKSPPSRKRTAWGKMKM